MFEGATDARFGRLAYLAAYHQFVKDLVYFVKVEHKIKLTHRTEVLVQHLDKQVDEL